MTVTGTHGAGSLALLSAVCRLASSFYRPTPLSRGPSWCCFRRRRLISGMITAYDAIEANADANCSSTACSTAPPPKPSHHTCGVGQNYLVNHTGTGPVPDAISTRRCRPIWTATCWPRSRRAAFNLSVTVRAMLFDQLRHQQSHGPLETFTVAIWPVGRAQPGPVTLYTTWRLSRSLAVRGV